METEIVFKKNPTEIWQKTTELRRNTHEILLGRVEQSCHSGLGTIRHFRGEHRRKNLHMCLHSVACVSKVVFDRIYKRKLSFYHLLILQMPRKKSKDKFLGIPSWDKSRLKQKNQSQSASEACSSSAILESTVPEVDDGLQSTVEENVPPTASKRKLMGSDDSTSSDVDEGEGSSKEYDPSKPYYVEDPGYRFFHLSNVYQAFQDSHKCKNAKIIFNEDQAKRYGQSALFSLECSRCKKKTYLPTSKSTTDKWDPNDATDINRHLVYAASETGIGREGMSTICSILNMPQPMSKQAWNNHVDVLYNAHKQMIEKHLTSRREKL